MALGDGENDKIMLKVWLPEPILMAPSNVLKGRLADKQSNLKTVIKQLCLQNLHNQLSQVHLPHVLQKHCWPGVYLYIIYVAYLHQQTLLSMSHCC